MKELIFKHFKTGLLVALTISQVFTLIILNRVDSLADEAYWTADAALTGSNEAESRLDDLGGSSATDLSNLESSITELRDSLDDQEREQYSLQTDIDDLESRVEDLESEVSTLKYRASF